MTEEKKNYSMLYYERKKGMINILSRIKKVHGSNFTLDQNAAFINLKQSLTDEINEIIAQNPIIISDYVHFLKDIHGCFCEDSIPYLSIDHWIRFSNSELDPFDMGAIQEDEILFTKFAKFIEMLAQLSINYFGDKSPEIHKIWNIKREIHSQEGDNDDQ